jgi:hypothetical protein
MGRWGVVVTALALGCAGCASTPPPPMPVRPIGNDVVLAWTIERGLYDGGVQRATEVVTIRAREGKAEVEVQDFGTAPQGDGKPRTPTVYRRDLKAAELDTLNRALFGLELPDVDRRREAPAIVPWTLWGVCFPTRKAMQCGQLLADEWNDVNGARELFAVLQTLRQESVDRPDR